MQKCPRAQGEQFVQTWAEVGARTARFLSQFIAFSKIQKVIVPVLKADAGEP